MLIDFILASLSLALNMFQTLFKSLHCWVWTGYCLLGEALELIIGQTYLG